MTDFGYQAVSAAPGRATIVRGADLLTMDSELGECLETDVLIEDGKIAAIGKALQREGAEIVEARGKILMPGMIDGHRHVWEGIDAGRLVKTHLGGAGGFCTPPNLE